MKEEMMKHVNELAEFTKNISPEVWEIMVKQQIARGYMEMYDVVYFVVFIPILIGIMVYLAKGVKASPNDEGLGLVFGICLFIFFFILGVLGSQIKQMTHYLYNPEYQAIKDIVEMMGGG